MCSMMKTSSPGPGGSVSGLASGYGFLPKSGAILDPQWHGWQRLKMVSFKQTGTTICSYHVSKYLRNPHVIAGRPSSQRVAASRLASRLDCYVVAKQ